MTTTDPSASAWEAALDDLEAHCAYAESLIGGPGVHGDLSSWTPPADIGSLPSELVSRALRLSERQRNLIAAMPVVLTTVSERMRLIDRVGATHAPQPALYLDVNA
jgi:hypothetical protein